MAGPFDSAWLKWGRAVAHAQALDAYIEGAADDSQTEPFGTIRVEFQPKRHGFSVWIDRMAPIPRLWSLMLGDVAFNFRASLDHLAWALVQRGTEATSLPREEQGWVYFPIATSAAHLRSQLQGRRRKLPGVRHADLTIVRRHQPYHYGKTRAPWHCLSILDDLSNRDKHREIHDVRMIAEIYKFEIRKPHDCVMTRTKVRAYRRLADIGTEIAFVRVRKTGPNPKLDVDYNIASHPAFHPRLFLQYWLDIITVAVMQLLGDFADMPDEMETFDLSRPMLNRSIAAFKASARPPRLGPYPTY